MDRKKSFGRKIRHCIFNSKVCKPRTKQKFCLTREERKTLWLKLNKTQSEESSQEGQDTRAKVESSDIRDQFIGMTTVKSIDDARSFSEDIDNEKSGSEFTPLFETQESSNNEKEKFGSNSPLLPETQENSQSEPVDKVSNNLDTQKQVSPAKLSLTQLIRHCSSVDQGFWPKKPTPTKKHKLQMIKRYETTPTLTREDLMEYACTRKRSPPWKRDKSTPLVLGDHIKRRFRPVDDGKWKYRKARRTIVAEEPIVPPEERIYLYPEDELFDHYFLGNKKLDSVKTESETTPKSSVQASGKVSMYCGQVKTNKMKDITQIVLLDQAGEERFFRCFNDEDVNNFPSEALRLTLHKHRVDFDMVSDDAIINAGIRVGLKNLNEYLVKHSRKSGCHSTETHRAVNQTKKESSVRPTRNENSALFTHKEYSIAPAPRIRMGKSFMYIDYDPSSEENDDTPVPQFIKKSSIKINPDDPFRRGQSSDKLSGSEENKYKDPVKVESSYLGVNPRHRGKSEPKRSVTIGKQDKEST